MDVVRLPKQVHRIAERGRIDAADVIDLRRSVYADGAVGIEEADALFWLNDACRSTGPQWREFFVSSLVDFFLNRQAPVGYIDERGGDLIAARVLRDGRIETATELELLVSLIEKAARVPRKLILFVLGEVRISVLGGDGPIRRGLNLAPGVIAAGEVDLLRRVIHGMGSDGNVKVSRLEAELLFDLNDAIVECRSYAAWADLFVKAIANYVMAAELWTAPSHDEAARREAWLERRDGALGFMRRMAAAGAAGALDVLKSDAEREAADRRAARERAIGAAADVNREEAEWLARRIGRDGTIHENERALLGFLRANAPAIHPSLKTLIERAA